MKKYFAMLAMLLVLSNASNSAEAASLNQWASSVIGYSSQAGTLSWSAKRALGTPNTSSYGDKSTAWAPVSKNGTNEYLTLGFGTSVYSTGALIHETWGNGFVYRIDAVDNLGAYHQVWNGIDTSLPGTVVDFQPNWETTSYLTAALKIYVDTNHNLGTWEEIDAVQLNGNTDAPVPTPAPEPSSMILGLLSLGGLFGIKKRNK